MKQYGTKVTRISINETLQNRVSSSYFSMMDINLSIVNQQVTKKKLISSMNILKPQLKLHGMIMLTLHQIRAIKV